jgi:aryl carrier-like protein
LHSEAEHLLAGIWRALLGGEVGPLHADSDFFSLGGHSLLAMRLSARLREVFPAALPLRALFETPTLAAQAARLLAEGGGEPVSANGADPATLERDEPRAGQADGSLSFAQERLWFLQQMEPESGAYIITGALRMAGTLCAETLAAALDCVLARQEGLRTHFPVIHGRPRTEVLPAAGCLLERVSCAGEAELQAQLLSLTATRFALDQGPLLRVRLLRIADDQHVLGLAVHHIVADGWSLGILLTELAAHYASLKASGQPAALAPLPLQVADVAAWQRQWLDAARQAALLAYWRERLADLPPLDLPTDFPRPALAGTAGATLALQLPAAVLRAARERAICGGDPKRCDEETRDGEVGRKNPELYYSADK